MGRRHGCRFFKVLGMVLAGIAAAVLFALIFGLATQFLWNYFVPDIFGLKTITYWQAFALVILAKILFGSFGSHHGHRRWHKWRYAGCEDDGCPDSHYAKWKYYKDFWRDEGKKAFQEYVKKMESEDKKVE